MALTQADLDNVQQRVKLAILDPEEGVPPMIEKAIVAAMHIHVRTCPHGIRLDRAKWLVIGAILAAFVFGGGSVLAAVKFLM